MRATRVLFGGGRHYQTPKTVWTPAGGWWNAGDDATWQRYTAMAFAGVFVGASLASSVSRDKEVRSFG